MTSAALSNEASRGGGGARVRCGACRRRNSGSAVLSAAVAEDSTTLRMQILPPMPGQLTADATQTTAPLSIMAVAEWACSRPCRYNDQRRRLDGAPRQGAPGSLPGTWWRLAGRLYQTHTNPEKSSERQLATI